MAARCTRASSKRLHRLPAVRGAAHGVTPEHRLSFPSLRRHDDRFGHPSAAQCLRWRAGASRGGSGLRAEIVAPRCHWYCASSLKFGAKN